jgi:glutathione S-transferase
MDPLQKVSGNSNAKTPIKLYFDYFSQPSRACWALCVLRQVPFEIIETRIAKGANQTSEFLKKWPLGKVPVAEHDGLYLFESNAILRYICNT